MNKYYHVSQLGHQHTGEQMLTITYSSINLSITLGRTLSEFWHWFVANIPGDSVDDGEVTTDTIIPPQVHLNFPGHF